jgi:hypothetical protein
MFNPFRKNPKQNNDSQPPRVLRIARMEWTTQDMEAAAFFTKSPTFKKMKAWCDEQLMIKIIHHGSTEEFREGWIECQRMYEKFAVSHKNLEDSVESTDMQFIDETDSGDLDD